MEKETLCQLLGTRTHQTGALWGVSGFGTILEEDSVAERKCRDGLVGSQADNWLEEDAKCREPIQIRVQYDPVYVALDKMGFNDRPSHRAFSPIRSQQ